MACVVWKAIWPLTFDKQPRSRCSSGGICVRFIVLGGGRAYLNTEPEEGQDDATDDTKVTQPETKGGAVEDGESDVETGPDCSIQDHDDSDDAVSDGDSRQGLTPGRD